MKIKSEKLPDIKMDFLDMSFIISRGNYTMKKTVTKNGIEVFEKVLSSIRTAEREGSYIGLYMDIFTIVDQIKERITSFIYYIDKNNTLLNKEDLYEKFSSDVNYLLKNCINIFTEKKTVTKNGIEVFEKVLSSIGLCIDIFKILDQIKERITYFIYYIDKYIEKDDTLLNKEDLYEKFSSDVNYLLKNCTNILPITEKKT